MTFVEKELKLTELEIRNKNILSRLKILNNYKVPEDKPHKAIQQAWLYIKLMSRTLKIKMETSILRSQPTPICEN